MLLRQVGLIMASLAIFVIVSPLPPENMRDWQEVMFLWGGMVMLVMMLADTIPLQLLGLWVVSLGIAYRGPASFQFVLFFLVGLGFYRAALRTRANYAIRAVAGLMVAAIGLQALELWMPLMTWLIPSYHVEVYNPDRILVGWTASTGDAGVVLAMAAPFFTSWTTNRVVPRVMGIIGLGAILAALLATQATSAIVAGFVGVTVAGWPHIVKFHRKLNKPFPLCADGSCRVGGSAWALWIMLAIGITSVLNRLDPLKVTFTDDRWQVWKHGLIYWFRGYQGSEAYIGKPWTGHGLGTWETMGPMRVEFMPAGWAKADVWEWAHSDLLQFGFETGIVGVALALIAFFYLVYIAYRSRHWPALGGMAALGIAQFGHFVFHIAVGGLMACLVAGEAGKRMKTITESELKVLREKAEEEQLKGYKIPKSLSVMTTGNTGKIISKEVAAFVRT